MSLADLGILGIKNYHVASWCPDANGKAPAEAVALHLVIDTVEGDLHLAMRLKTAQVVDTMIAALERHRNDVWPGG